MHERHAAEDLEAAPHVRHRVGEPEEAREVGVAHLAPDPVEELGGAVCGFDGLVGTPEADQRAGGDEPGGQLLGVAPGGVRSQRPDREECAPSLAADGPARSLQELGPGPSGRCSGGTDRDPACDGGGPAGDAQPGAVGGGRREHVAPRAGLREGGDAGVEVAVLDVPPTGPHQQVGAGTGPFVGEVVAQQGAEEGVVAEPAVGAVGGGGEQVLAVQRLEHRLAPGAAGDGVAQRAVQAVEHGRGEEEAAHVVGEAAEDLLGEVVGDVPVVDREGGHEGAGVGALAEREGRQLEAGGPTLGPRHQLVQVRFVELDPGDRRDQLGGLASGERQLVLAQLDERLRQPEAVEAAGRVHAGGDDRPQRLRRLVDERGELVEHRGVAQLVEVVDDEGGRWEVVEGVEHRADEG